MTREPFDEATHDPTTCPFCERDRQRHAEEQAREDYSRMRLAGCFFVILLAFAFVAGIAIYRVVTR